MSPSTLLLLLVTCLLVSLTQLFFLRPATVLQVFILWPLSDPGGIRDSTFTCTDLTEICHRADSTEDLGELCLAEESSLSDTLEKLW
ncbi:uncharacterized protein UHOD_11233 [Ustilago sp. UG-2017b]|nr:uncharacterized protein UHOD_11233 [Ustilago sp. UG-2017b]